MFKNVDARTFLALFITIVTVIAITVLSVVAIVTPDESASGRAQSIMNVVLPLFGTWIGTVLAYYFSRENFESAAAQTQQLIQQISPEERLQSTPVEGVMTKTIFSISDKDMPVEDAYKELQGRNIKRLLIVNNANVLEALLFVEGLTGYLLTVADGLRAKKTLSDLLAERADLIQPAAYVAQNASLADAKAAMEDRKSKVVLVTRTGRSDEPILGLLTNTDIAKYSHA
jgi:signal-transduction protein with cAMP-binding, CBS, and nucleotidyltransferase domain